MFSFQRILPITVVGRTFLLRSKVRSPMMGHHIGWNGGYHSSTDVNSPSANLAGTVIAGQQGSSVLRLNATWSRTDEEFWW